LKTLEEKNIKLAEKKLTLIVKNFRSAHYSKLKYTKLEGVNQVSKGLDAILRSVKNNNTELQMKKLFLSYVIARGGPIYDVASYPEGDMLPYVLEMFRGAKINDIFSNDYNLLLEKHRGKTFQLLENFFFGRYIHNNSINFTDQDNQLMNRIYAEGNIIRELPSSQTLNLIYNLTKDANVFDMQKVNYLARESITANPFDFNNFFLKRAKIVDYGVGLASADRESKLPRGKAQRFVEEVLKIN